MDNNVCPTWYQNKAEARRGWGGGKTGPGSVEGKQTGMQQYSQCTQIPFSSVLAFLSKHTGFIFNHEIDFFFLSLMWNLEMGIWNLEKTALLLFWTFWNITFKFSLLSGKNKMEVNSTDGTWFPVHAYVHVYICVYGMSVHMCVSVVCTCMCLCWYVNMECMWWGLCVCVCCVGGILGPEGRR